MIFKKTVTKREKKKDARKRLIIFIFFLLLISLNLVFVYKTFIEKPDSILNPLSSNQVSSTEEIGEKLKTKKIAFAEIESQKDLTYLVKLKGGGEVIFDPNKDIDEQLASLQLILSQLKIEGKALKRLDFRFEKPVITF